MARTVMMPEKGVTGKYIKRVINEVYKKSKVTSILIVILILISSMGMVYGISNIESLIDNYIPLLEEGYASGSDEILNNALNEFYRYVFIWGSILFFASAASFTGNLLSIRVSQRVMRDIKHNTFSSMQYLPVKFFDSNKYGDIMSRYTNDIDTIDRFVTEVLPNFISVIFTLIVLFISMLINNWYLSLLVVFLILLMLFTTSSIMKNSAKHFRGRQKIVGQSNGYIEEMMEGARVVQVFNHQKKSIDDFEEINERFRQEDMKANIFGNIMPPLTGNLVRIQFVIMVIVGSLVVMATKDSQNPYTIGMLVSFLLLSNNFSNPVGRLSQQVSTIAQAGAGAMRIYSMIETPKEEDSGYVTLVNVKEDEKGNLIETEEKTHKWAWKHPHKAGGIDYVPLKGDIVLDGVDFSYVEGKQILYDISIYANEGERVALVGETGAGKTTITNLINRFYDIEDGKIRYDGININKIKKEDLRKSLGLVLQDTNLFTGTIEENIKLGKPDATHEEVVEAAKIANADSFIRMMPDGYNTILTRAGEKLSQGQRQLLAIARAAIADSPVLILDEATSSIDTRTEKIIQEGMDRLMNGRTTFVIAHRLSTIQNSDVIMVMDHGRIIERGNHSQLLAKKGVYYQLYTGKFELE